MFDLNGVFVGKFNFAIIHIADGNKRMNGHAKLAKQLSATFEGFFNEGANAQQFGTGNFGEANQADNGLSGGEKVIDNQDRLLAEVLGRDDELYVDAFGVAGGNGDVDLTGHGNGLLFAGVNDGHVEVFAGHQGRRNAGDFGGEDFDGAGAFEDTRELGTTGVHEIGVNLMIDEAVDFKDAFAEVFAFL